jgi:hypothetical protein
VLTRAGVAKRLQRSIATVRRLEGRELFPWRDARGVHRFNEGEVNALARALELESVPAARGTWLRCRRSERSRFKPNLDAQSPVSTQLQGLRTENAALRAEADELRRQLSELLALLETFAE